MVLAVLSAIGLRKVEISHSLVTMAVGVIGVRGPGLQIRRSNKDNLGIIIQISS